MKVLQITSESEVQMHDEGRERVPIHVRQRERAISKD